jgi:hypothetical protein
MIEGAVKDILSHWGIASVAQFLTQLRVAQGSCPCMRELFHITFDKMILYMILANYMEPDTILNLNVKSVKTRLLRRFGLHMATDLVSQLP